MNEVANLLGSSGIDRKTWDELSHFMITNYDHFPSLKQMWEFLEQRGAISKKKKIITQAHCSRCDNTGYLFAAYKDKRGAVCCMCAIGQDIKTMKKDMADIDYVLSRGGVQLTNKEYTKGVR